MLFDVEAKLVNPFSYVKGMFSQYMFYNIEILQFKWPSGIFRTQLKINIDHSSNMFRVVKMEW